MRMSLQSWQRIVGPLPEGFFLEISNAKPEFLGSADRFLDLRYNGPGFQGLIQPGGARPRRDAASAFIAGYNIEMRPIDERELCEFIRKSVEALDKPLSSARSS